MPLLKEHPQTYELKMTATIICKSHVFKTVIGIIRSPDFKILYIVLQTSHLSATLEKKGGNSVQQWPCLFFLLSSALPECLQQPDSIDTGQTVHLLQAIFLEADDI